MDEELRALEQRARATPDDSEAAVRYGLALARTGERGRAALELARAVEVSPGSVSALKALDSVAPGGLDPESPWPCSTGDAGNTRRSRVRGPDNLKIVRRVLLERELDLRYDLAVDSRGRLLATYSGGPELARPPGTRFAVDVEVDFFAEKPQDISRLVSVALDGKLESLPTGVEGGEPTLLVGWTLVHGERQLIWSGVGGVGHLAGGAMDPRSWLFALGHVVRTGRASSKDEGYVEAIKLGGEPVTRWRASTGFHASCLVLVGVEILALGLDGIRRIDFATGEPRGSIDLERSSWMNLVVGRADELFVEGEEWLLALSGSRELWRRKKQVWGGASLARSGADLLVVFDIEDGQGDVWLALGASTGAERWRLSGLNVSREPKVDGLGRVYLRRGESLVLLDPETGQQLSSLEIGTGWRDFAFAGEGTIALLRRVGVTRTELVVVGE